MINFVRKIWQFIKNIWLYKKVLWLYRSDDYVYSIMMFRRSLELMYNLFKKYEVNHENELAQISRLIELLKNVEDDNYLERINALYDVDFSRIDDDKLISVIINDITDLEENEENEIANIIKNNLRGWWI